VHYMLLVLNMNLSGNEDATPLTPLAYERNKCKEHTIHDPYGPLSCKIRSKCVPVQKC